MTDAEAVKWLPHGRRTGSLPRHNPSWEVKYANWRRMCPKTMSEAVKWHRMAAEQAHRRGAIYPGRKCTPLARACPKTKTKP